MNKKISNSTMASLVSDAYALGAHWVYEEEQLNNLPIDWETLNDAQSMWHQGKAKGDFTHYGDQTLYLLEYMSQNKEFDKNDYYPFWSEKMSNYGGYVDGATRNALVKIGSESNDLSICGHIAPLLIDADSKDTFVKRAKEFAEITHNSKLAIDSTAFFAELLWDSKENKDIKKNIELLKGKYPDLSTWIDAGVKSKDAYIMMQNRGYRHIIVTNENDEFIGVVSEGDFLRHIGYIDVGTLKAVEDIMSEAPLMIESDSLIVDVAKMMSERHVDTAIVMKNLKAHGVVRERDVTRYYANKNFSLEANVKEIIHKDLHLVSKSIPLPKAAEMMEKHGIHQLVVADSQEKIIGIIKRHEVLKTIHGAYFETLLKTIREKNEDLDESKKREEELQKKDAAMNEAQSIARVGSWSIDLNTNILIWSNECYNIFGIEHGTEMSYELFVDLIHKDDKEKAILAWDEALKGAEFEIEHRVIVGTEIKWVREKAKFSIDEDGNLVSGIGTVQDITERKQYENKLERLANFDTLTGFANRTFLFSYLQKVVHRCKRTNKIAALLVLDMDHFKDINDSYGHDIGDELLTLIAKRLSTRIRGGDFIARLDGDEFAIILEDIHSSEDAAMFAKEIMQELEKPFYLSNTSEVHISATAGIVIAPKSAETAEELIQFADTALYKGKKDERGSVCYYSDELTKLAKKHIELESRLRRAIENNEFELYYQPQVHIKSKRIVAAEALIRWNDPEHGLISPNDFIPLAEETGLIGAIGEWVIRDACRQGKLWIDKGYNLSISVNVSVNQLRHQNISELIESTLKKTGFTADKLVVELTESAIMQREEEAVGMLHAIRAKGIRLAIDDFGTGYSSYSYLKRFPIDILKIDKSFIDEVPFEKDDMAIVKAIIAMGSALGYKILAEGTEHIEQIDFLEEHGCEYYQGYYKSKPLKATEFEKLLL